jgi:hypothetical protein
MTTPHSIERFIRIYNDDTGDYFQVGPDSDGLELVELQDSSAPNLRFAMPQYMAVLVAKAILELYGEKNAAIPKA